MEMIKVSETIPRTGCRVVAHTLRITGATGSRARVVFGEENFRTLMDQGCQYTSIAFGRRCRDAGVQPSMGIAGDCFDNSMCESFFGTLEAELLVRGHFATHEQARRDFQLPRGSL